MKVLLIGYQKSGKSASKLLKKLGYKVVVIDDDRKIDINNYGRLLDSLSFIVVSPAVLPDSPILKEAEKHNIKIIGELELGTQYLKGNLIAITGTNGKTTTTYLVDHLLKSDNTFIGGNVGIPITSFAPKTNDDSITVAEVSSFQLMHIDKFRPHVAAFLNLTPDHLNYHKTMQDYLNAKLNIFANQTQQDFAILNADDAITASIRPTKSKVYYFSTKKRVNGCFVSGGNIYFRDTTKTIAPTGKLLVAKVSDINLLGEHNLSNVLCAICCALVCGLKPQVIKERLKTFKPVEHRLQYVTDIDGVSFINDSKATNISSAVCAIDSMTKPTTIILGGSDKGCSFDDVFNHEPTLIKNYVLMGETQAKLLDAAKKWGRQNVFLASSLSSAVELAYRLSSRGENVLFSPACASFDMFDNYEQRGKCFCGIVRGLKKSENNRIKNNKKT